MNPGRLEEQPMPLIVTTLWGETFISASTFCSEDRTPKSPQPGHQSGSTFPLKSDAVSGFVSSTVAIFAPYHWRGPTRALHQDFVHRHGQLCLVRLRRQLLFDRFHNVMRHERFAIVLADVAIRDVARLTSEVARELSAVVVLHDDGVLRKPEDVQNSFPVQRDEPPESGVNGGDTLFIQDCDSFANDAFCGTPADQGDICVWWADERGEFDGSLDAADFSLPLFH